MKKSAFNIRYLIEDLEIKHNPLLSSIKVYLVSEGVKKKIAENDEFYHKKMYFQANIEEEGRILSFNSKINRYESCKTSIQLEF